ncbi:hypothetical protein HMPREF0043_01140 [Actinobaculum sp. oral taxon 183 str. F0552]|uniref:hypothetical protein n=1 Tax=Actinobaculum sp. oral taxon 183 TaxID=712888 RepID=UPI000397D89C|nr:hypothetical protein [Actinobaculum sp. oral taxon 183]ERH18905.1 hypothetical protein HMPREF0043_01140 [Actinobaculum sp. oral taxon 183 str. F0552]
MLQDKIYYKILFSIFSLSMLATCSNFEPKVSSSYMTPVANTNLSDYFHMKIPSGWKSLNRNEYVGMASYRLVRQAENSSSFTGIQVIRIAPEHFRGATSDADGDNRKVDMSKYCIESMSDARKVGVVSVKKLPPRIIDKLQTCGYSGYEVHESRKYFVYYWFVWRHDGMWEIFINSDPDADEIPRELVKTLDTIRWERR